MPLLLDGQVALVTGAARGLGHAIAACFSANGARGTSLDLASAIAGGDAPAGFSLLAGDTTDEASLAAAVAATVERYGRLDIVVANAGLVPPWRETETLDLAEWDRVMAVNARGVAATLKHAVPAMKAAGGSIVVMASINAYVAHGRQMLYTASKHAALGILRAAALDLGRYGIRVNGIAPGPIATDALLGRIAKRAETGPPVDEALAGLAAQNALGRLATADEVAKVAVFLASDLSSGVTGELIPVDAGLP
jgi:NAD(P)-dependent dehydrogenase (short-subunit alcohol dehydrogenase family)